MDIGGCLFALNRGSKFESIISQPVKSVCFFLFLNPYYLLIGLIWSDLVWSLKTIQTSFYFILFYFSYWTQNVILLIIILLLKLTTSLPSFFFFFFFFLCPPPPPPFFMTSARQLDFKTKKEHENLNLWSKIDHRDKLSPAINYQFQFHFQEYLSKKQY